jgi:hydrogenase maturation protein HypF
VGFRPFVYRLAHQLGLDGWVRNAVGQVQIVVQGPGASVDEFLVRLVESAPPLARPAIQSCQEHAIQELRGFKILPSEDASDPRIYIPPDYFCCDDCLQDINTPGNRRYRYPFTNCTQCGPRYTLIQSLPYDRQNTSMAGFPLCDACRAEYENPMDRRFHAEPVACPDCGPAVELTRGQSILAREEQALEQAIAALVQGAVLAVKGVGGYHLMCDARNQEAVQTLRKRKHRPDKPLAVMFPQAGKDGLATVRQQVVLEPAAADLARGPARPIVLAPRVEHYDLAPAVAPGLKDLGVFLPYSPLHHLLLSGFGGPLVATSGNLSGEPVLTRRADAVLRLGDIADLFLQHDRPIVRPADDPVWKIANGVARPIRHGRGSAPLELSLPGRLERPLLAVGGHMKNTLALAWEDRIVVSPHIGDMSSARSLEVFEQLAEDMQRLYGVTAAQLAADAHPGYTTHRWALERNMPVTRVFHHHAHASALCLDSEFAGPGLIFSWDGVGYGEDGSLWGGEALFGRPGDWRRVASMKPFRLPGADLAASAPWRSAAGMCWEAGLEWATCPGPELVRDAWQRGINSPKSSAVGRIFDAAAALIMGRYQASFEGQGPMELEAIATQTDEWIELPLGADEKGLCRADWTELIRYLLESPEPTSLKASVFHESMARCLLGQALRIRDTSRFETVGLTGGVFQNALLTRRCGELLQDCGFQVLQSRLIPCNDAGISAGQVMQVLNMG